MQLWAHPLLLWMICRLSLGSSLSGKSVTWSAVPIGEGVNVENGMVTIGESTPAGSYTITASAGGTAYDEIILSIEDATPQSKLTYNGLMKRGGTISGGLTLQIVNDNPNLERCDVIVAVYEKDGIALGGLKKISASINMGTSKIDLDILSFSVDPIKTYVVRIFSWTAITTLKPIAEAFITDV